MSGSKNPKGRGSKTQGGRRRDNPAVQYASTDTSIIWIMIWWLLPSPASMELFGLIAAHGGPFAPLAKKLPGIGELRISNLSNFQKIVLIVFILEDFVDIAAYILSGGVAIAFDPFIPLDVEHIILLAKIDRMIKKGGKFAKWAERLSGQRVHHEMEEKVNQGRNPSGPHGRAMTDGGQPNGGRNRRNPPQGGNGLRGYSDIRADGGGSNWGNKLKKALPFILLGVIVLALFLGAGSIGLLGGVVGSASAGLLSGLTGFLTNPLIIGGIIFIGLTVLIFKAVGSSAGGKFLLFVPLVLIIIFLIGSLAIGGNPLAYLGYGDQVADSYAGALFGEVEGAARVYGQARARVFCLLQGPACLRQWQLNNTQRPGSEDVGETYGLKIDRFQVGQGEQFDIAYQDSNTSIPVSFTLSNPRHGLKGINAEDVSYRLRIVDSDRGQSNPYCDTGWIDIQEAYDIDGDGGYNDIFPGTAASTGFLTIDEDYIQDLESSGNVEAADGGDEPEALTLENCEMLQPALGQNRVALLNVKYDYFSQATLNFEAMSRDYFQSNEEIEKSIKQSETADTPVKAAINVNSPVLFDQQDGSPQPFAAKATLNTDKNDIEYKVNDFQIRNSRYLKEAGGVNCKFTNASEPGKIMELDDNSKENIIAGYDDSRSDSYYWFDTESNPPIFGCVMQLDQEELGRISPSGETLTMNIKTNYTVSKKDSLGSFEVYNSICSRVKCPLIVTTAANQSASEYNFRTVCKGIDAGNGCSIVEPSFSGWEQVEGSGNPILNRMPLNGDGELGADTNIEKGEIAVAVEAQNEDAEGDIYYGGLKKSEFEQISSSIKTGRIRETDDEPYEGEAIGIVHYTTAEGEKEMEIVDLDRDLEEGTCEYRSSKLNSELLWKNCGFDPDIDLDGSGGSDDFWTGVFTSLPPLQNPLL